MRALFFLLSCLIAQAAPTLYSILPTGSMKPALDETYYVFVEPRPFGEIRVGDIIIYRTAFKTRFEGKEYDIVCHRVWRRSSSGRVLLAKGDNNPLPDQQLITEADYVGSVVAWIRVEDYWKPGTLVDVLGRATR